MWCRWMTTIWNLRIDLNEQGSGTRFLLSVEYQVLTIPGCCYHKFRRSSAKNRSTGAVMIKGLIVPRGLALIAQQQELRQQQPGYLFWKAGALGSKHNSSVR